MSTTKSLRSIITLSLALIVLLGYGFISAWAPPTGTAPANNVEAPIHVGSTAQDKSGTLTTAKLGVISNGPTLEFIDATAGEKDWRMAVEGGVNFVVRADRNQNGNWGDDVNHPIVLHSDSDITGDYVTFSNEVRATLFCNRNGTKCASMDELINLLPQATRRCTVTLNPWINGQRPIETFDVTGPTGSRFAIGIAWGPDGVRTGLDYYNFTTIPVDYYRWNDGGGLDSDAGAAFGYWSPTDWVDQKEYAEGLEETDPFGAENETYIDYREMPLTNTSSPVRLRPAESGAVADSIATYITVSGCTDI